MWSDPERIQRKSLYRREREHGHNGEARSVLKGALAGMAGGLVAAGAMTLFQNAISAVASSSGQGQSDSGQSDSGQSDSHHSEPDSHGAQAEQPTEDQEDATMKMADAVAHAVSGEELTREQKQTGGTLVHYAFGAAVGALYGALAEVAPRTTYGHGAPFGAAVWVGADEIGVPALGLSKTPTEYPASTHAQALASHIVYGLTTDTFRRLVRRAL